MNDRRYFAPHGGLPGQTTLLTDRAVFTEAYAFIPKGVMRDIVTSYLPFWDKTRAWIIARPLSGFARPAGGGGSVHPRGLIQPYACRQAACHAAGKLRLYPARSGLECQQ